MVLEQRTTIRILNDQTKRLEEHTTVTKFHSIDARLYIYTCSCARAHACMQLDTSTPTCNGGTLTREPMFPQQAHHRGKLEMLEALMADSVRLEEIHAVHVVDEESISEAAAAAARKKGNGKNVDVEVAPPFFCAPAAATPYSC